MTAPIDVYSVASGQPIYGGMAAPTAYGPPVMAFPNAITSSTNGDGPPDSSDNGKIMVVQLHGSSGENGTNGTQYRTDVSGTPLAYLDQTIAQWSTVKTYAPGCVLLRPYDDYGTFTNGYPKESMWLGFSHMPEPNIVHMITRRRMDSIMLWAKNNLAQFNQTKTCLIGESMGAWGTMTYGLRNADKFAALYPDRPRWRYDDTVGNVPVSNWIGAIESIPVAQAPTFAPEDGGGSVVTYWDSIAYVSNTANKVPWIGWVLGSNDGFTQMSDHIAAVAALRAAKRGFAFFWNTGGHMSGPDPALITNSYPYGTFEIGKGYPLFTGCSLDKDPSVDATGSINGGLSFRNVIETASGWSCEITNITAACTVSVEPISSVFKAAVAKQSITIPAANNWVPVSFTA